MTSPVVQLTVARETDPWPAWWQSFARELRLRDRSPMTVRTYGKAADSLHRFLVARDYPTDPLAIERRHLEDWMLDLTANSAAPATRKVYLAAIKRFFHWLEEEEEEIERSPAAKLRPPIVPLSVEIMSEAEQQALLAVCAGKDFAQRRDAAMLRLMIDTGARRSEVAGMLLAELDMDDQAIPVVGKGNRPALLFFGVKVARDLDRYLRVRTQHPHADRPELWLGSRGPLRADSISRLVVQRAKQAGIDRVHVHAHLLRHQFGHAMKESGVSDENLMELGRWRDPAMMARYGRSARLARAREAHRQNSPGDRL